MNEDRIMIGDRLKHLINENGMDIDKDTLLTEFGFAKSSMQKYLTNVRRPSLEHLVNLARIFNTSVDYIVGYTDYVLDTWDYDFLKEFGEFSKEKINDYFIKRGNYTLPSSDTHYTLLFYIVFNSLSNGRTLEDFIGEEKEKFIFTVDTLVKTCMNIIDMPNSPHFSIAEAELLHENIQLYNDGDYRFTDEQIISNLEENTELEHSEKIALLKSYLQQNIATTQRAINLLNELENE
ncbi:helix-turn-helix domain-containing protein [Ureibacillus chungkukjangi]|uniref:HTH cro/C1-type domain-containing protein n=1 Tax=Ureibacillus chungkukjangi TaxID=1202712 RepID=A0A318TVJ3_9BACL|nr:helix-turn-helix transcriptional regulator [Ureibacillus chungkukjangi]PYF07890.1 hypothetical protein BJ095_10357 [Ureibacillus chungkukjangi]